MGQSTRLPLGTALPLLLSMIAIEQDECTIWTHARNPGGYAIVRMNGTDRGGHVIACESAHGPRPKGLFAAHNCGVRACINPRHLRWATPAENVADMLRHGTMPNGNSHPQAKLQPHEVLQIRAMFKTGQYTRAKLAEMFGVTPRIIRLIITGQSWKHLPM